LTSPKFIVIIRNNKITNTRGHGIKTDSGGPTGEAINRGAWEITGNYFENIGFYNGHGFCTTPLPVSAIWLAEAGANFWIANNTINNVKWAGVLCDGYGGVEDQVSPLVSYDGAVTITGNRVDNTVDSGIQVGFTSASGNFYYPLNAYITNNTVTNANTSNKVGIGAITILSSNIKGVNITYNDVSTSFNGLAIEIAGWQSSPDITYVNNNNFYSLSGGFGVTHIAGIAPNGLFGVGDNLAMYNFENNYWGAASGPTYSTNPGGTGVGLKKDANTLGAGTYSLNEYDFSPFLSSPVTVSSASLACCEVPSATINYSSAVFCTSSGAAAVTRTGTAAGIYQASPSGLTINKDYGSITPATSTPGTYTVTYLIAAGTGCSQLTATAEVKITANPAGTTIAYTGSPFCKEASTVNVNRVGSAAGTYSASPAGLTIDANTGAITPSSSTANTYTITYTVNASGCTLFTTTANVTIKPALTAGISGTTALCSGGNTNISFTGTANATVNYTVNGTPAQTTLSGAGTSTVNTGALSANATYALVSVSDGICPASLSGSAVVTVISSTANTALATSSIAALTESCTETNGWTYYANPLDNTQLLFAINWDPSSMGGGHNRAAIQPCQPNYCYF
jgi:hypothetical protein